MSLKLLLKVNRLCSMVEKENLTARMENLLIDVLLQIVDSDLPSMLFNSHLYDLINRIKEHCNHTIMSLIERYHNKLQKALAELGVDSINELTPEIIGAYYDKILSNYEKPEVLNECYYKDIYKLILDRDILVNYSTEGFHYVQPDIVGAIYSIDPDLIPFYDGNKLQHLRDVMMLKFNDYKTVTTWKYTLDRCKTIIQSHTLEFENDLESENETKDYKLLSELESEAYWTIRWWIIYSMFLAGEYSLAHTQFVDLLTTEKTHAFVQGDSVTSLTKIDSEVIDATSLLRIVYLSTLVSKNNLGENKIHEILSQSNLIGTDKTMKDFRENLHVFQMQIVQDQLTKIKSEIPWIEPLEESFNKYRIVLIQKSLLTYLSCVHQTTYVELSQTFHLDIELIKQILEKLIALLNLPFVMDNKAELLTYKKPDLNIHEEKIQASIRDEIVRLDKTKINKMIASTNESDSTDH